MANRVLWLLYSMKIAMYHTICLLIYITHNSFARSVHRPVDKRTPEVSICWDHDSSKQFHLKDCHIEFNPIFSFDHDYFMSHRLPSPTIDFVKNNQIQTVPTSTLNDLIEELLVEIKHNKRTFKHFTIIKKRNFSFKKQCGLIILAFKDYPFVLKLFIETPQTFFDCHAKGIESVCLFYMSGGTNRHVTGLTRIKNREYILNQASKLPAWKDRITIPRKWFWLPKNDQWLTLEGQNIGTQPTVTTKLPAMYAVIADFIYEPTAIPNDTNTVLQLCNDLNLFIDGHEDNFIFRKRKSQAQPDIIIIDTEHFPSVVGLKKKYPVSNYFDWYFLLIKNCFYKCYLRLKYNWINEQRKKHRLTLIR